MKYLEYTVAWAERLSLLDTNTRKAKFPFPFHCLYKVQLLAVKLDYTELNSN
jgi:hypothetical protein